MATDAENRTLSTEVANVLLQSITLSAENYGHPDGLKALAEAYATVREAMPKASGSGRVVTTS